MTKETQNKDTRLEALSENERLLFDCIEGLEWGSIDIIVQDGKVRVIKQEVKTTKIEDIEDLVEKIRKIKDGYFNIQVQRKKPVMLKQQKEFIKLIDTR